MARQKAFPTSPIVVVFKSGKKVKMKVINNKNIDEVLDGDNKIPGIKDSNEIIDIGLGESFIRIFSQKHKINLAL
jgi:hypothetical protein